MIRKNWIVLLLLLSLALNGCQAIQPQANGTATPQTPAAQPTSADSSTTSASANLDLSAPLPFDANVRTGVLENGMTYYIRQNAQPQDRAELWLAVNAGSVLEDDDQRGLAHLLEHMLFNGTERFPKHALIDFLQSIGMKFGADVNASTSFDETVYTIQVPTDNLDNLGKSLDVLQDWASAALIEPSEVDAERGVVIEEWRLRDQGANGRILNQWLPLVLADSRYAERLPIGDVNIIQNAPAETVRRFYEKWYRPDLMSVIAVGDFDPTQMESMIKERFGAIAKPTTPLERPNFEVPFGQDNRYKVISDPEYPYVQIDLSYRKPYDPLITGEDYRRMLIQRLANQMLNVRFDQIAHQSDAPFIDAGSYSDELVRATSINGVQAQVSEDKITAGLDALVTELERVQQHGFTASELDRARTALLRRYESAYNEREKSNSPSYAQEYLNYFLTKEATPGIAYEYDLVQKLLPGIQLDEVNQQTSQFLEASGRDVLLIAPEKQGLVLPTEQELANVVDAAMAKQVDPYVDQSADTVLLKEIPQPAAIVAESSDDQLGTTTLKLANGVTVVLKPTDFKNDEILFNATSFGGSSLVSDEDAREAQYITSIVSNSGVGDLDYDALSRLLSGKLVRVNPYIRILTQGMNGQASPQDLETLFQLIYLYATQPRADASAFDAFQAQMRSELQNRQLTPSSYLVDAYNRARYGDSIRFQQMTLDELNNFDLERAFAIYKERFANMGDATFLFVGSFTVDAIKPLVQSYLGALPSTGGTEMWKDVVPNPPTTAQEQTIYRGKDEQSTTLIEFDGIISPTLQNQVELEMLQNVLQLRLTNELRERLGGTYSPGVSSTISKLPDQTYTFRISYGSDPKRVDELEQATWENLNQLMQEGPSDQEFTTTVEQLHREQEGNLRQNSYWLSELTYYAQNPELDAHEMLQYDATVDAVTPGNLQALAKTIFNKDQSITLVLLPEAYKGQ